MLPQFLSKFCTNCGTPDNENSSELTLTLAIRGCVKNRNVNALTAKVNAPMEKQMNPFQVGSHTKRGSLERLQRIAQLKKSIQPVTKCSPTTQAQLDSNRSFSNEDHQQQAVYHRGILKHQWHPEQLSLSHPDAVSHFKHIGRQTKTQLTPSAITARTRAESSWFSEKKVKVGESESLAKVQSILGDDTDSQSDNVETLAIKLQALSTQTKRLSQQKVWLQKEEKLLKIENQGQKQYYQCELLHLSINKETISLQNRQRKKEIAEIKDLIQLRRRLFD